MHVLEHAHVGVLRRAAATVCYMVAFAAMVPALPFVAAIDWLLKLGELLERGSA